MFRESLYVEPAVVIEVAEIEQRQQSIARARGFALQEHALSLYGNCTKEPCPHRPKR